MQQNIAAPTGRTDIEQVARVMHLSKQDVKNTLSKGSQEMIPRDSGTFRVVTRNLLACEESQDAVTLLEKYRKSCRLDKIQPDPAVERLFVFRISSLHPLKD